MHDWFQTPAGQYLLRWEDAQLESAVADIFGYHALQLGVPQLHGLRANRMPHQWLGMPSPEAVPGIAAPSTALVADYAALPFSACSLDLVVLPHTLELSADPHTTLREVERVLVPEGRVVICGLNPVSLWGLRQRRAHALRRLGGGALFLPDCGEFIGYWRLRDWLRLLGFEVEVACFGCYRPAVGSQAWLDRWAWMDSAGPRWWPIMGAAYFLVAVKRVRGMRVLGPAWKTAPAGAGATVPAVQRRHGAGLTQE
ncbi:SAM-dependent methyltransferase [Rhodoferax sp. TH121]|nr:SAM-dependent methyltransferase [Rhodoferax sp. TH121]